MTVQLVHSKSSSIWGKFDFLFDPCGGGWGGYTVLDRSPFEATKWPGQKRKVWRKPQMVQNISGNLDKSWQWGVGGSGGAVWRGSWYSSSGECEQTVPRKLLLRRSEPEFLNFLCTGCAYNVPYSCLLISNKFCNGVPEQGEQKFLYAPAPPPPSVWALKPPSWALVHKTTYAPMTYTVLCIMLWMRVYPLLGQVWGGWALWNGIEPIGECHLGPENL